MKKIFLLLFFTISSANTQTVDIGNDLDLDLDFFEEINKLEKNSPHKIEDLDNYVTAMKHRGSILGGMKSPKKAIQKKTSLKKKFIAKKAVEIRRLDPALQREMDLLNEKIDLVELESKNKTIEEKKLVLNRPLQYETYKTIRKIPLNDIKAEDDVLKQDDEIIEIKFTNLMDKEL